MIFNRLNIFKSIATVCTVAMLFSCKDYYEGEGEEKQKKIFPKGVARNFVLTYTESIKEVNNKAESPSRVIAVLKSDVNEDFGNLSFPYQTFPEGLVIDFFDKDNNKSVVTADYGIIYAATNLIDFRGNVVIDTHDGKRLETPQLFWDRASEWIFTQEKFKFTNPEDETVLFGEGMDFNKEMTALNAHKTTGIVTLEEKIEEIEQPEIEN